MLQAIEWTCPVCAVVVPVSVFPINCQCGSRINRDGTVIVRGTPAEPIADELIEAREAACADCGHAGRVRCDLIDAGCRRTYQEQLYSLDGKCPLGLWPEVGECGTANDQDENGQQHEPQ